MENAIPATEARHTLGKMLSRVEYRGERLPIERHGKVVGVLICVADFELLERLEDAQDAALADEVMLEDDGTRISLADAKKDLGL